MAIPARSFAGRLLLYVAAPLALAAAAAALGAVLDLTAAGAALLVLAAGLPAAVFCAARFTRRWVRLTRALSDGVEGLRGGDFSLRLAVPDEDVVGRLVRAYNDLAEALARERGTLRQRELLLQGALEASPAAIVLVGEGGRVIYGNRAARRMLRDGHRLEGHAWSELVAALPVALGEALARESDAVVPLAVEGEETFQVVQRAFELDGRSQRLVTVHRLTVELRRQEVAGWKKAIRVVGHEVRSHLAAIRSLVRSSRTLVEQGDTQRAVELLGDIDEAGAALQVFIDGYGRFARLPEPRREEVELKSFLLHLAGSEEFRLEDGFAPVVVPVDPGQLRQALVNLLKNAREAGSPPQEITVAARSDGRYLTLEVRDRGCGMDAEALSRALLPFHSTKPGGSGLGLALCREIVEAHGGELQLRSRQGGGLIVGCRLPLLSAAPGEPAA
jgi:nitrogen fixation/metabolism regulation signal transduction histidine kinase